jgi:hypothetical protein
MAGFEVTPYGRFCLTPEVSRYNTPVAELVPPPMTEQPYRKFGTLKGKAKILDPRCFDPMTDEEVDGWIEGR